MYKISLVSFELFIRGKNKFDRNISKSSSSQRNPFTLPEAAGSLVMYRSRRDQRKPGFPEGDRWGQRVRFKEDPRVAKDAFSRQGERARKESIRTNRLERVSTGISAWQNQELAILRATTLLSLETIKPWKILPFYVLRLRYKLLIFRARATRPWTDENLFPSLNHRDDDKSFRNFLILQW